MRDFGTTGSYEPRRLFDGLRRSRELKNDAELATFLEVGAGLISKVRHGRLPLSGALLIRIHEQTGISICALKQMIGDRRAHHRISDNKVVAQRREEKGKDAARTSG